MNTVLANIPVERRELLFAVDDHAEIVRLAFEHFDFNGNYRIVTKDELCEFTNWDSGIIKQGDCFFWDNFNKQYQKTTAGLLESERMRGAACLIFCKDYLGAKKGFIVRNKSENSADNLNINANFSTSPGDKGSTVELSADVKYKNEKEAALKLDTRFSFESDPQITFNPEKARKHYEEHHLDMFEEFRELYEFRKNSPIFPQKLSHTVDLSFFQRGKRLIEGAIDVGAKLKGIGLDVHTDFKKDSEQDFLENLKIEVWF